MHGTGHLVVPRDCVVIVLIPAAAVYPGGPRVMVVFAAGSDFVQFLFERLRTKQMAVLSLIPA